MTRTIASALVLSLTTFTPPDYAEDALVPPITVPGVAAMVARNTRTL